MKKTLRILSLVLVVAMMMAICATASALEYPAAAILWTSTGYDLPERPASPSLYTKSDTNNNYTIVIGDDVDWGAANWNWGDGGWENLTIENRVAKLSGKGHKYQLGVLWAAAGQGWYAHGEMVAFHLGKGNATFNYLRDGTPYTTVLKVEDFDAFDTGIEGAYTEYTWTYVRDIPSACTPLTINMWVLTSIKVTYPDDAVIGSIYVDYTNDAAKSIACAKISVVYRNDDGRVYTIDYNCWGGIIKAQCQDGDLSLYWSQGEPTKPKVGFWHAAWHRSDNGREVKDSTLLNPAAFPLKRK